MTLIDLAVFGPPGGTWRPPPGATHVEVFCKAGDGGASSAGNPGGRGQTGIHSYSGADIPSSLNFSVGRGGRGYGGGQKGEDGVIIVASYRIAEAEALSSAATEGDNPVTDTRPG